MTRLRLLLLLALALTACNLPDAQTAAPSPTTIPASPPTPTAAATQTALPTPQPDIPLGAAENPIVLALIPSREQAIPDSARDVAAQLSQMTGLVVVPYAPATYKEVIAALAEGRVHIAILPPFAYILAHEKARADIALATIVLGQDMSAAQFLVNRKMIEDRVFTQYYDEETGANLADASAALKQFADKKPCWTDAYSATGYVLPLGILNENGIATRPGAFVQGHATVVKSLYQDSQGLVCQFGATIADARVFIASGYGDAAEKVAIVWKTEAVVPFDGIVYAQSLPDEMRVSVSAAFLSMIQTEEGNAALRDAFQVDGFKLADDTLYNPLRRLLDKSGLLLTELVR